ncbi:MAG: hypothetical protein A3C43_07810 [Candidatus Schekmanbacteria bacterium RIFCSPHIGHO2_02_FULL_38_11]|uniref:Disulfide oxidoreductase n=1 Tax=Candidatus Schekmanbacteria bacterium RIFCSPLOWO2_12_FULL_38_15 TaxID=1817883 RepID=A0A1F7SH61_9BACT|nr:MAG: hypothetical protein A2043_10655 [Candidatus Schekmanbacteria bacterium GWA2_38_9]OGL48944.1 MAG: hypothetical protein A3H37_07780 [Candidatus Schekmanbacteria bacterium RIFCSPLOWO2_02_FULL_38_14]OGL50408.1 MAG: hypothetical protein A3C43_07810 [Candidatus Schekmanbacteria bacterium RIFCSPHIGHO2_02_FULL_38_11]OGL53140.1 MAG: hypothetical protein A3G31_12495 [Candidatus Schekmanbacteria bacterium RIFCSPLOWO2_12_FULL_38_15]
MEAEPLISKDMVINDVIKKYPKTVRIFNELKVDACCGGGNSIEKTARADGVDVDTLLKALNKMITE